MSDATTSAPENLPGVRRGGPATGRAAAGGFTLLELVVVLALVAIAVSLVAPAIGSGLRHWRLRAATREVATLFKFARTESVARMRPLQVVLDRPRNLYWLDNADLPVLDDPAQAEEQGIRLYALPAAIRFGEVSIDGSRVDADRVGVVFFPRGASTGGEVQILDDSERSYRIRVDAMTGRARITRDQGFGT